MIHKICNSKVKKKSKTKQLHWALYDMQLVLATLTFGSFPLFPLCIPTRGCIKGWVHIFIKSLVCYFTQPKKYHSSCEINTFLSFRRCKLLLQNGYRWFQFEHCVVRLFLWWSQRALLFHMLSTICKRGQFHT